MSHEQATKTKATAKQRKHPRCSVSFHPDVWRFVAACVESWAAMSRALDKTGRPEPDAHRFALNMADWTAAEIRNAAGKSNDTKEG
jgi:hypothetical protein